MEGKATDKQISFLAKKGVKVDYGMSKQEASKLIDEIISKQSSKAKEIIEPETDFVVSDNYKPRAKFDTSSYYVAYAKDLLIAMIGVQRDAFIAGKIEGKDLIEMPTLASQAIQIVMSMRNQFKE